MQQAKGPGDALGRFRRRIERIRAKQYRQYQRAIGRAVNQAVRGLGLGDEASTRVLEVMLEREIENPELRHHRRRYWDSGKMPIPLRRGALMHDVEEILSEQGYEELREVRRMLQERELEERMEKRRKVISESGELHFLFVERDWDPDLVYGCSGVTANQTVENLGLNPHNTITCLLAKGRRGRGALFLRHGWHEGYDGYDGHDPSFPLDEIRQYCKGGAELKLCIHDACPVPRVANQPARRASSRGPSGGRHLSAYLGETRFGSKTFPWYLGRHDLSKYLSRWLRECRKGLRERGQLTEAEAQQILAGIDERYEGAKRRSLELLRETVGKRKTDEFLRTGHLVVKSSNGRVYRITRDGEVVDAETGKHVCVEVDADDELPIYDEILSKYLVIRDHPEQIETLEREPGWDESVPSGLYEQIRERSGLSRERVAKLIERKQAELAYQVTALGAALLVARELGVKLGEHRARGPEMPEEVSK